MPNKATVEMKDFAYRLISDPEYQATLRRRILAGEATHMESLLWFYCVGKPKDTVRLEGEARLPPTLPAIAEVSFDLADLDLERPAGHSQ